MDQVTLRQHAASTNLFEELDIDHGRLVPEEFVRPWSSALLRGGPARGVVGNFADIKVPGLEDELQLMSIAAHDFLKPLVRKAGCLVLAVRGQQRPRQTWMPSHT